MWSGEGSVAPRLEKAVFEALAMGRQMDIGSVETGKLADLVVLSADPAADIRNCRQIEWVIKGGTAYKPRELVRDESPRR